MVLFVSEHCPDLQIDPPVFFCHNVLRGRVDGHVERDAPLGDVGGHRQYPELEDGGPVLGVRVAQLAADPAATLVEGVVAVDVLGSRV